MITFSVYIAAFIFVYSASYAFWNNKFPNMTDKYELRFNYIMSIGYALFCPFTILMIPFLTNFFFYGFQLYGPARKKWMGK